MERMVTKYTCCLTNAMVGLAPILFAIDLKGLYIMVVDADEANGSYISFQRLPWQRATNWVASNNDFTVSDFFSTLIWDHSISGPWFLRRHWGRIYCMPFSQPLVLLATLGIVALQKHHSTSMITRHFPIFPSYHLPLCMSVILDEGPLFNNSACEDPIFK